jgi:glutamate dehydrogenase/leucine dehydrogenase
MRAFGAIVNRLGGRYVTAEDVGTTPDDMDAIGAVTPWAVGRPTTSGGRGDPSSATARTVLAAITAAIDMALDHAHVGVMGVGSVGSRLTGLLRESGARVTVADVDVARACAVAARHNCDAVAPTELLERDTDVLAPCALGGLIGAADVPRLRCRVVAGAANNPLRGPAAAVALHEAGILYVPDFLANCGGIIHVAAEYAGEGDAVVERRIASAGDQIRSVLREAHRRGCSPLDVALAYARERLMTVDRGFDPGPRVDGSWRSSDVRSS